MPRSARATDERYYSNNEFTVQDKDPIDVPPDGGSSSGGDGPGTAGNDLCAGLALPDTDCLTLDGVLVHRAISDIHACAIEDNLPCRRTCRCIARAG